MRIIALLAVLAVTAVAGGAKAEVSPRPSCVATARVADGAAADRVDCFAIDKASELRHWNTVTKRWANLGRVSLTSRSVSCLRSQDGYLHCFYVGRDGLIQHRRWQPDVAGSMSVEPIGGIPATPTPGAVVMPGFVDHIDNDLYCTESGDNNMACMVQTIEAPDGVFRARPGLYMRRYLTSIGGWSSWQSFEAGTRATHCRRSGTSIDSCTMQYRQLIGGVLVTRHQLVITHDRTPGIWFGEAALVGVLARTMVLSGPLDPGGAGYPRFTGGLSCLHIMVSVATSTGVGSSQTCFGITETGRLYHGRWVGPSSDPMTWTSVGEVVRDLSPGSAALTGDEQAPNCFVMNPPASREALTRPENLVFTCVQVTGLRELRYFRLAGGTWTSHAIATSHVVTGTPSCAVMAETRLECLFRTDAALGRMNGLVVMHTATGVDTPIVEIGRGFVFPRRPR